MLSFEKELIFYATLGMSCNQPQLSGCASWSSNATLFSNEALAGRRPSDIFIDSNNTMYMNDQDNGHIMAWLNGSSTSPRIILTNLTTSSTFFVTSGGDIYVYESPINGPIIRMKLSSNIKEFVANIDEPCTKLFVDHNNSLYCSSMDQHRVMRMDVSGDRLTSVLVAGVGCAGLLPNMLHHPHGVFLDISFNLYVADTSNDRIQRFARGEADGITVMGFGALIRTSLHKPTSVILNTDGYLYVVDSNNHRIVRSTCDGFKCLVGCSSESGSAANQLSQPQSMAFDSIGNILVTDTQNSRIQKFILVRNSCGTFLHS